ncbi:hypothetical protein CspeluHIS016_0406580 [Cutaneotrichosporon spelunceum]|uniref:GDP-Man:Man(3)GlcNAc(2)-PP-Dol alpha-1,2-mannosyltransferase n=1 Tax=Cutaneotrichosporon spelunceum TaxID=1672016 RepID=A0AAD3TVT2_9TREE|nr:hypothetical protein CspeluHIS016_0406580 [Cutaneotrichosporon spelunceum]
MAGDFDTEVLVNYAILYGYFAIILACFTTVIASVLGPSPSKKAVLSGRPFVFIRCAVGGLISTWYFMIKFIKWSYTSYVSVRPGATMSEWLVNTSLFVQAWRAVCVGPPNWWWSSWICTAAIFFAAIIWSETFRRGIKYPVVYMILGQLVAISVAIALFLTAVYLHEPIPNRKPKAPLMLCFLLISAQVAMFILPELADQPQFAYVLGFIHTAVVVPLFFIPKNGRNESGSLPFGGLFALLVVLAAIIHTFTTLRVLEILPSAKWLPTLLYKVFLSHPAQASVSWDVVWVAITFIAWWCVKGSATSIVIKSLFLAAVGVVAAARHFSVNWVLVASCIPILALLLVAGAAFALSNVRSLNEEKRAAILEKLGIKEQGVIPGTPKVPPTLAQRRTVVGFWHPYCNAGGGGERVLWTAIAWLQRVHPKVVVLVYSGDYPAASKEEILAKVNDRFSIKLSPATLAFIPLRSRHLISDTYWRRFTLLGQSVGSVLLAWEGLCGRDGVWGDIFIDSMGYAFTLPFARLVAGRDIAIGSYTHYPTVSSDMVKRVRERVAGVENGGASGSAVRTWAKLVYYRMFTSLYSVAVLFSQHTMTNSSWTQAHIKSLLNDGRRSLLAQLLLMDDASRNAGDTARVCEVVFPPCDTTELSKLGNLDSRNRELVSLAQFRPEKDQAKQLHALGILFEKHPEYKAGPGRVHLTLMGGCRDGGDEARVQDLRKLAAELNIEEQVTFLVNAPYPEIVAHLGTASVGLNTMQDEHFGINVVEFMAAGLIPIVHASAGPLLDIVVPHDGIKTGFHATDAESFADAIHQALSLPLAQDVGMRRAARSLARGKFSEILTHGPSSLSHRKQRPSSP